MPRVDLFGWLKRLRRPKVRVVGKPKPPAPRAIPLVREPDAAALAALPRPIRACPDCGFVGIAPIGLAGGIPGSGDLFSAQRCRHCGYVGPPVEFDHGEEYAAYVASLRRAWRVK